MDDVRDEPVDDPKDDQDHNQKMDPDQDQSQDLDPERQEWVDLQNDEEWMALIDPENIDFFVDTDDLYQGIAEVVFTEAYTGKPPRAAQIDEEDLNMIEAMNTPPGQANQPLPPVLAHLRNLRCKLWYLENHHNRAGYVRSQIAKVLSDPAVIAANLYYFDRQMADRAWNFDVHNPASIVRNAKISIQNAARRLRTQEFKEWKDRLFRSGRQADHMVWWSSFQDPKEMPYILDIHYKDDPVPRKAVSMALDYSEPPSPMLTPCADEERIPIHHVGAIINDDDIEKVLTARESSTPPESSSTPDESPRKRAGPFSITRRSAITPERTPPREIERPRVTLRWIERTPPLTSPIASRPSSPLEKEEKREPEEHTVKPISLKKLADGKSYNIVKRRRNSDGGRSEERGEMRDGKRRRSDTPESSARPFEPSTSRDASQEDLKKSPDEFALSDGSEEVFRKMVERVGWDDKHMEIMKAMMMACAKSVFRKGDVLRDNDDESNANSSSALPSNQDTGATNSPINLISPPNPININAPGTSGSPTSASSLLMIAPSMSSPLNQPIAPIATTTSISPADPFTSSSSHLNDGPSTSSPTNPVPPINITSHQFRPRRAASPPLYAINWPRGDAPYNGPSGIAYESWRKPHHIALQPASTSASHDVQQASCAPVNVDAEQRKRDEEAYRGIRDKIKEGLRNASDAELRVMADKLMRIAERYKGELMGDLAKEDLEMINDLIAKTEEKRALADKKAKARRDRKQRQEAVKALARAAEYDEDDDEKNVMSHHFDLSRVKSDPDDDDVVFLYAGPKLQQDGEAEADVAPSPSESVTPADELPCSSSAVVGHDELETSNDHVEEDQDVREVEEQDQFLVVDDDEMELQPRVVIPNYVNQIKIIEETLAVIGEGSKSSDTPPEAECVCCEVPEAVAEEVVESIDSPSSTASSFDRWPLSDDARALLNAIAGSSTPVPADASGSVGSTGTAPVQYESQSQAPPPPRVEAMTSTNWKVDPRLNRKKE